MRRLQHRSTRRTRTARRLGSTVAVAVAVAIAIAGSAAATAQTAKVKARAAGLTTLTIDYAAPAADQMLVELASTSGIFRKYGIDAKTEYLQQSLLLPALASGQVQFAVAAAPGFTIPAMSGTPLEMIGQWENANDVVLVAGPKIGTAPASADGKSVGITTAGSLGDYTVHLFEEKYNVKMTEIPIGNSANGFAAYTSGVINAASAVSPWQLGTYEQAVPGSHILENFRNLKGYPAMGVVTDQSYASKHRAIAIKVMEAFIQAAKYWRAHPAAAIADIAKFTDEPTSEATQAYHDVTPLILRNLTPSLQDQKNVLKALAPMGYPIPHGFSASKLINTSYVAKAYKTLAAAARKHTKKK